MTLPRTDGAPRHVPVMLREVLEAMAPRDGGIYVDGTFGAGGYTRAMLNAARCRVFAIDRDPEAIRAGSALAAASAGRLALIEGRFGDMAGLLARHGVMSADGVVLDIGVSSMQIDDAARGFSFLRDGPLDMRMSRTGTSAADAVNSLPQDTLAQVIAVFGEERKARAIARAIVAERSVQPLATTSDLVRAVERATGPQRARDKIHPATRTFQALRIYVNGELDELARALRAAEVLLCAGGRLAVVTFHSLEDRIVKRFLMERAGRMPSGSRHMPGPVARAEPSFELLSNGHLEASTDETAANPRARSAKLRAARRTAAEAHEWRIDRLGLPQIQAERH